MEKSEILSIGEFASGLQQASYKESSVMRLERKRGHLLLVIAVVVEVVVVVVVVLVVGLQTGSKI